MGAEERIDVDLDAGMEEDAMRPRINQQCWDIWAKPGKQTTCVFLKRPKLLQWDMFHLKRWAGFSEYGKKNMNFPGFIFCFCWLNLWCWGGNRVFICQSCISDALRKFDRIFCVNYRDQSTGLVTEKGGLGWGNPPKMSFNSGLNYDYSK